MQTYIVVHPSHLGWHHISRVCIHYHSGDVIPAELEWMLSEKGAVKTDLEEDPRKKREIRDVMTMAVRGGYIDAEDSDDDTN